MSFLASLDIPCSGSVATCIVSMFLSHDSLASVLCVHVIGGIVGVALLDKHMFVPESAISKLLLVGECGAVSIL